MSRIRISSSKQDSEGVPEADSEGVAEAIQEEVPADSEAQEGVTEEKAEVVGHLEVASGDRHVVGPVEDSVAEVAPEEGRLVEAQEVALVVADADHAN